MKHKSSMLHIRGLCNILAVQTKPCVADAGYSCILVFLVWFGKNQGWSHYDRSIEPSSRQKLANGLNILHRKPTKVISKSIVNICRLQYNTRKNCYMLIFIPMFHRRYSVQFSVFLYMKIMKPTTFSNTSTLPQDSHWQDPFLLRIRK